jgi:hypothetical protein
VGNYGKKGLKYDKKNLTKFDDGKTKVDGITLYQNDQSQRDQTQLK